jgi:type I restriction enzyme S subunit
MRLRDVAAVDPPTPGFSPDEAGVEISFLPLDRVWHDSRFDPSTTLDFDGDTRSYTPVLEGDVLVPKVAPTFGRGRVALARGLVAGRALATSEVFVVRTPDPTAARFLQYRLQAADFITEGVANWTGVAGLKRISSDFLRDVRIDRGAWSDRDTIARFLDAETAGIDALMAQRTRQGALLIERRRALMFAAVSGRLGAQRHRRSSDVPWLMTLPEHWSEIKLTRVARLGSGAHSEPLATRLVGRLRDPLDHDGRGCTDPGRSPRGARAYTRVHLRDRAREFRG